MGLLIRLWTEFAAHTTWHLYQPQQYFEAFSCDEVPEHDFIECPWCHRRYERECPRGD